MHDQKPLIERSRVVASETELAMTPENPKAGTVRWTSIAGFPGEVRTRRCMPPVASFDMMIDHFGILTGLPTIEYGFACVLLH